MLLGQVGVYLSKERKIVIIGCGAGGGTAAQFARKTDRKASVTIIEKDKYPQYSKCGLPHAISGIIPKFNDLIEFSDDWFKTAKIDLLLDTKVEKIDTSKKIVNAQKGSNIIEKPYDSLIIATGAKPSIPPIDNILKQDNLVNNVFVLRTIDDAKDISSSAINGNNATIIGAGLIGLELAESLYKKEMKVTVVEALPTILANTLDKDMSKKVNDEISKKVEILTDHIATKIESNSGKITKVFIKDNKTGEEKYIQTDLLVIATGLKPDTTLAKDVGCKLNDNGYINVNNKCQTSVKDIYAVGDCTEFKDFITKKPVQIGLGSIAVRQGISAGIDAAGGNYTLLDGFLQTCTSDFFGIEIAAVGSSDENLVTGKFNGLSLPHYFPGGKSIAIKVFANDDGKILGAQAVGDNAAQRINTIAAAILGGLDIETFRRLETAYAPPIAPTLDAITLACDIISAKLSKRQK
jgi:NADH oxidase (H2O2-forming)